MIMERRFQQRRGGPIGLGHCQGDGGLEIKLAKVLIDNCMKLKIAARYINVIRAILRALIL